MNSVVERAREIVKRLYERNLVSWNDLDREVVFAIQALNAEVQRLEAKSQPAPVQEPWAPHDTSYRPGGLPPNDSFERDEAAQARVREFMRNH